MGQLGITHVLSRTSSGPNAAKCGHGLAEPNPGFVNMSFAAMADVRHLLHHWPVNTGFDAPSSPLPPLLPSPFSLCV